MRRAFVVFRKEVRELLRSRGSLFAVVGLPILCAVLGLAYLYTFWTLIHGVSEPLPESLTRECGDLAGPDCLVARSGRAFQSLFVVLAGIVPATAAAQAVVGEKSARTLEPLLATPLTRTELLGAKALAISAPPVLACWTAFGLWAAGLHRIAPLAAAVLVDRPQVFTVLVLGPLLSLTTTLVTLVVSSRVAEARTAQQIAGLLVAPGVGLVVARATGSGGGSLAALCALGGVFLVADLVLGLVAVRLFDREAILTRWR